MTKSHLAQVVICLEDYAGDAIRLYTDRVDLAEGSKTSTVMLTRVFTYPDDPFYGELKIDRAMLREMVKNFNEDVYGQRIAINISHSDMHGAAGFINKLHIRSGNKLFGDIEWTALGVDAIHNKGFRYFSVEFINDYKDPETEDKKGTLLVGAALTIRPRVKRLDPINPDEVGLSENIGFEFEEGDEYAVSPQFKIALSEEITKMWEIIRKKLAENLRAKGLSEDLIKKLCDQFINKCSGFTEEAQAQALADSIEESALLLAEQINEGSVDPSQPINLSVTTGLSQEEVLQLMEDERNRAAAEADQAQERLDANVQLFSDTLSASDTFTSLSEENQAMLNDSDLITADMTEEQVKKFAESQLKIANQLSVTQQLADRGFNGPHGNTHISIDDSNAIRELQETTDRRLGLSARDMDNVSPEVRNLVEGSVAMYDAENAGRLHEEAVALAGGQAQTPDVDVPAIFERTVIREALYDLNALRFVNIGTYPFNAIANLPYSYRDTSAAGKGKVRKYEGQGIKRSGMIQTSEEARPIPQKLSFKISDELRYLTAASIYNWDIVQENALNAIRIIREDLEDIIMNEILKACLEFQAVAVTNEAIGGDVNGTNNVFLLDNFPVVRPRSEFDLKGNQVGNTVNPVTVSVGGSQLSEYDGTGEQAAGNYYLLDYDLGELSVVNEDGVVQTPANATAIVVSYSYATNLYAFDTDLPGGVDVKDHWSKWLYRLGLRKSMIKNQRYYNADLGIMSETYKTAVEQARDFSANFARAGTSLNEMGSLGKVKGVPIFESNAPGLHMGDRYLVIGERNTTRFRMMKPWQMGQLQDARDANGDFTGEKEAYGDQFVVCHTPTQLKAANTAIMQYSSSARVVRAI